MTTIGKYRHLTRCSTDAGHLVVLAIDHRDELRGKLAPIDDAQFSAFKLDVITALLPQSAAVLTDPAFGIAAGVAQHTIGGHYGLLAPLEVTNYDLHPSQRDIAFIPDWDVAKIKRAGGDGVKLLLTYHWQAEDAAAKRDIVRELQNVCDQHDIPFYVEPIPFSRDAAQPLGGDEYTRCVIESAKQFSKLGVDVLKMPFPVDAAQNGNHADWRAACEELNAACSVPWALLSAGVDYETFAAQTEIACKAGASGVIVGRAVWAEAVERDGEARRNFLHGTARERMAHLASICEQHATPWYERVSPPDTSVNWFETY